MNRHTKRRQSNSRDTALYTSLGLMAIAIAFVLVFFMALLFSACKMPTDGNSTSDFSGTYAGQSTYSIPAPSAKTVTSTLRVEVVQSDRQMTVSGTETILGEPPRAMPAVTGTVSVTGFFTPQGAPRIGTWDDVKCGRIVSTKNTLAFANSNLRITETILTPMCGSVLFSALLIKES